MGIATTIAHQERHGQFADNKRLQGATDAAGNKAVFRLSTHDAKELAPEFTDEPTPAEVRLEPHYGISQKPVHDLLEGGAHPCREIREFVRRYLLPMKEQLEDIRDDMEEQRLIRMDFFDEAMLFRIEDAMHAIERGPGTNYEVRHDLLSSARGSILRARATTRELQMLHHAHRHLKWTVRGFNKFFTSVMEGAIRTERGVEEFAQFLVERARAYNRLAGSEAAVLELYLYLYYGNPEKKRTIPFTFARDTGLYGDEVQTLTQQAGAKTQSDLERVADERLRNEWQDFWYIKIIRRDEDLDNAALQMPALAPARFRIAEKALVVPEMPSEAALLQQIDAWHKAQSGWFAYAEELFARIKLADLTRYREFHAQIIIEQGRIPPPVGAVTDDTLLKRLWTPESFYSLFYWWQTFPQVRELLAPFRKCQFTPAWKFLTQGNTAGVVGSLVQAFGSRHGSDYQPPFSFFNRRKYIDDYRQLFRGSVVSQIVGFLREYQEGALVVLALLAAARNGFWRVHHLGKATIWKNEIPGVAGVDPLALFNTFFRLNAFMVQECPTSSADSRHQKFLNFFSWEAVNWYQSERGDEIEYPWGPVYLEEDAGHPSYPDGYKCFSLSVNSCAWEVEVLGIFKEQVVPALEKKAREQWSTFSGENPAAAAWWRDADATTRFYVLVRSVSLALGYQAAADFVVPEPTEARARATIAWLVKLQQQIDWMQVNAEARDEIDRYRHIYVDKRIVRDLAKQPITLPPDTLSARSLSLDQIRDILARCEAMLKSSEQAMKVLQVIDHFVKFCQALAKPENFVMGRTGVYVEKQVMPRPVRDMEAQKAQELMRLPQQIAYVTAMQKRNGEPIVYKGQVKIRELSPEQRDYIAMEQLIRENTIRLEYIRPREGVLRELRERKDRWLAKTPQAGVNQLRKEYSQPTKPGQNPSDQPPPDQWGD